LLRNMRAFSPAIMRPGLRLHLGMDAHSLRPVAGLVAMLLMASVTAADAVSPLVWLGSTELAAGRGERGPWQQNESRYDYVDDPTVAIDQRGDIAVAWVEQARKDVFFQRHAADGTRPIGQPVNVSRSPATFSWLPRIVFAPDAPHKVFMLWQEIIFSGGSHGGEIFFARSNDGGATFSAPVNLSNSLGGDGKGRINKDIWHNGSLDLIAGADGALYAAWTEYDGPLWFSRSTDGGASFSRPQRIAGGGSAKPARAPALALGPNRAVYLAWTVGEDSAARIRVATSSDAGVTFSEPRMVAAGKGYSDAPRLAVDSAGGLHLVYAESAGGPFGRYQIRYTRSTDGARSFEAPREISKPILQAGESAAFPALSIDANDNLYVLWELFPDYRQRPRGLGWTVSRDGGRTFTPPGAVPDSGDAAGGWNGSVQGLLMKKLAVNGAGAVAIVNSSLKQGEHSRVWLMRGEMAR
jgi:hypothetical protein